MIIPPDVTFERAFIHVLLRTILALEWFLPSVLADVTLHVAFLKGEGRYGDWSEFSRIFLYKIKRLLRLSQATPDGVLVLAKSKVPEANEKRAQ